MIGLFDFSRLALLAFWGLSASAAVLALLPIPYTSAFRDAVKLTASRGKTWKYRPMVKMGMFTNMSVPQSYFSQFYSTGSMCNALVLCALASTILHQGFSPLELQVQAGSLVALLLLQLHLCRRLAECSLLMRFPVTSRMHIVAYIFGLSYYVVLPVSLLPPGGLQQLTKWRPTWRPTLLINECFQALDVVGPFLDALHGVAILVFLAGNLMQLQAHWQLARLSRPVVIPGPDEAPGPAKGGPGSQQQPRFRGDKPRRAAATSPEGPAALNRVADPGPYRLPAGGLFEWVSCPHYLAEMVIYTAFPMLLRTHNYLPWLILTWVVANLLLAAGPTHAWYKAHFQEYPRHRRAVLPLLF